MSSQSSSVATLPQEVRGKIIDLAKEQYPGTGITKTASKTDGKRKALVERVAKLVSTFITQISEMKSLLKETQKQLRGTDVGDTQLNALKRDLQAAKTNIIALETQVRRLRKWHVHTNKEKQGAIEKAQGDLAVVEVNLAKANLSLVALQEELVEVEDKLAKANTQLKKSEATRETSNKGTKVAFYILVSALVFLLAGLPFVFPHLLAAAAIVKIAHTLLIISRDSLIIGIILFLAGLGKLGYTAFKG